MARTLHNIAAILALLPLAVSCSRVGPGNAAPDFSLSTISGSTGTLSNERGKVVLLDFWATWCPPCRMSLPHIQELSGNADLAARGLEVWTINEQEPPDVVQKFVTDNSFTFPVLMDTDRAVGNKYASEGIPTTVVIGRDGTIQNVFVGYSTDLPAQISQALDAALAKPG